MGSDEQRKIYDLKEAREKIRAFCVYRDRSHAEVSAKLFTYGLHSATVNELMGELVEEKYLDEERFARSFVRGKYSIKKWGRVKIEQALKPHKLSAYVLKQAFSEIDATQYRQNLSAILERKWQENKGLKAFSRRQKTAQYAFSRGYESELIWELLNELFPVQD
jgi:regulatory protein